MLSLQSGHSLSQGFYKLSSRFAKNGITDCKLISQNTYYLPRKLSSTALACAPIERRSCRSEEKIERFNEKRPLILLDFDGVINLIHKSGEGLGWPDRQRTVICRSSIYWSEAMVKKINYWSDSGLAEIRWLTSWDHCAQTRIAPALGLNVFALGRSVKTFKGIGPLNPLESKREAVINALKHCAENDRKLVWLEDKATREWKDEDKELFNTIGLVVEPKNKSGLSFAQVEEIEAYLKSCHEDGF